MNRLLEVLPGVYSVCQLSPTSAMPTWAASSDFLSITRTPDELSLVCEMRLVPHDVRSEPNWRAFRVKGPLDFSLTGVLESILKPLSQAGISVFSLSTFDTDYILVREQSLELAKRALQSAGFPVGA